MTTAILGASPVRSIARLFAIASAGMVAAACGSSPTGTYFAATDPIFDRHSRTMAGAEAAMFEVTSTDVMDTFLFGEETRTAERLLPIFRDTAAAIELSISEWGGIDVPVVTSDYHSFALDVMSRRLEAMRVGVLSLEAVAAGNIMEHPLSDAEDAMAEANITLQMALDEASRIRG